MTAPPKAPPRSFHPLRIFALLALCGCGESTAPGATDATVAVADATVAVPDGAHHADGAAPDAPAADECTIFVSTEGNDTNDGRETSAPLATLQRATEILVAGDVVCVRGGTYAGCHFQEYVGGTESAPIIFRPYPGEHVTIDKALMDPNLHTIVINDGASHLTLEGFEITDSRTDPPTDVCAGNVPAPPSPPGRNAIKIYSRDFQLGADATPADHVVLRDLHIHHNRGTAIIGAIRDSAILDNEIHDNGMWFERGWLYQAYGTYLSGDRVVIRGNHIYRNNGNGIRTGNTSETWYTLNDSVIDGNLVHDNGGRFCHNGEVKGGGYGIVVWGGSGNRVFNNVVVAQDGGIGVRANIASCAECRSDGNFIDFNTVVGCSSYGIYGDDGEPNLIRNNIVFQNGIDLYVGGATAHHNLVGADPLFVTTGDYHLDEASSAVDAAECVPEVNVDFDGTSRPQGAACDVGAFERGPLAKHRSVRPHRPAGAPR